jgi:hypothetical protein
MIERLQMYWPYLALTALVLLPLLGAGYILTLDAVFVPEIRMPETVSSDYLWRVFLHVLNNIVPSQIIEKAIFIAILLGSGIGMHQLLVRLRRETPLPKELAWRWAVYAGGILYMVNPFTYSRFMAGQYGVLLGYMLLPFFVRFMLDFVDKPDRGHMLRATLLALLIGIISVPTLGEVVIITASVVGVAAWLRRQDREILRRYAKLGAVGIGLFVVFSSYWLLPALLGRGGMAESVSQFDAAHSAAFATAGDGMLGRAMNALHLQGFWADTRDLYWLPQERLVGWGTVRLAVWALVIGGVIVCWRRWRSIMVMFGAMGAAALLVAIGAIPGLADIGYREPQKFVGLLALAFAVFVTYGTARLIKRARQKSETLPKVTAGIVVFIILLFTPTMYWGFMGQLSPRSYPADWITINNRLNQTTGEFTTVFVPWHQYMSFGFSGRIIANPAEQFFDREIIVSNDPELGVIRPPASDRRTQLGKLIHPTNHPDDFAVQLARHNVRYILLAKELDYKKYQYLTKHKDLKIEMDTQTLTLYRNQTWKEER